MVMYGHQTYNEFYSLPKSHMVPSTMRRENDIHIIIAHLTEMIKTHYLLQYILHIIKSFLLKLLI